MKEIPGFPDYYADEEGQIWSRKFHNRSMWRQLVATISNRSSIPYLVVSPIDAKGKTRWRYVHILVCQSFHGMGAVGLHVRHLDGDSLNNRPPNLSWGTVHENYEDSRIQGRNSAGERHGMSKLCNDSVNKIRSLHAQGFATWRELALMFGMSKTSIGNVINRKTWKHI
jgi:hypothetical protein